MTLDKLVPTTVFVLVQDSVTNCNRLGEALQKRVFVFPGSGGEESKIKLQTDPVCGKETPSGLKEPYLPCIYT